MTVSTDSLTESRNSSRSDPAVLYAAFDHKLYVSNSLSNRIGRILSENRGGNYGITGPRGAGKSWLMQEASLQAEDGRNRGLALWFPSPSEDDPMAFLAALSDVFAQRYIDHFINESPDATESGRRQRLMFLYGISFALFLGTLLLAISIISGTVVPTYNITTVTYIGATLFSIAAFSIVVYRLRFRQIKGAEKLYEKALDLSKRARYAAALNESLDTSGSFAHAGASLGIRRTRGSTLTERAATISSLVHDFREFATEVAKEISPILISIDELDKMESGKNLTELLKKIKGIFDIPRVHYLVSVSDEAARHLKLGGILERNEFNSSFYQVFELPPTTMSFTAELLSRRSFAGSTDDVKAIWVLSGGVPREIVRLADSLSEARASERESRPAAFVLAKQEVLAADKDFGRADYDFASGLEGERLVIRQKLLPWMTTPEEFQQCSFLEFWELAEVEVSRAWRGSFLEMYRRLLVRLAVAQLTSRLTVAQLSTGDPELGASLRDAVGGATNSAELGRDIFRGVLVPEAQSSTQNALPKF